MNNKCDQIMVHLQNLDIDVAFVCETWLTDRFNATTATIKSHGYDIKHSFRDSSRGGGTAIVFRESMNVKPKNIAHTEIVTFAYIAGTLKCSQDITILLLCVYRTGPIVKLFFQELNNLLAAAFLCEENIILAGDINIHMEKSDVYSKELIEVTSSYGLQLMSEKPTHNGGGCLDVLFYTSDFIDLYSHEVLLDIKLSDHFPVTVKTKSFNVTHKTTKEICFRELSNPQKMSALENDIEVYLANNFEIHENFEKTVCNFFNNTNDILNRHLPHITKTITYVPTAPWFDNEYKAQRALRRKAERKWRKSRTPEDEALYNDANTDTLNLLNIKKRRYYKQKIDNADGDVRAIYNILNHELDMKREPPLPDTENMSKLASEFNSFFIDKIKKIRQTFGDNSSDFTLPLPETENNDSCFSNFRPCTVDELQEILKDDGIKCGPSDFVPTSILKDQCDVFLPSLCDLVNLSLKEGSIDGLKLADIIPSIKDLSLDPNNLKNFRPLSNLSFLSKLIERVVLRQLNEHMKKNGLEIPEESAYKKHHSTETIMIKIVNDLLISFDSKSAVVLIMLDLSAAFDTVCHKRLLKILHDEIKISGLVLKWFKSFLQGRSQRIRLGSNLSEPIELLFGVPQGSVLGPVLFNIYIRSLYSTIKRTGFQAMGYADDQHIYRSFKPCEQALAVNVRVINCFLDIQKWMEDYMLQLNPSKTKIMVLGHQNILKEIKIHGVQLTRLNCIRFVSVSKNLGIHIDQHLTFKDHIMALKKDSFRILRNICKRRFLFSEEQLKILVNSLVVCKLDYCNSLYFGINEKYLDELQRIQNAAAKAVLGLYKFDHVGDSFKKLHWLPIRHRIQYKILLMTYKCLNGLGPDYLASTLSYANSDHLTYLKEPKINSHHGERAFCKVAPQLWNLLPYHVKTSSSLIDFKIGLKTHLFTIAFDD